MNDYKDLAGTVLEKLGGLISVTFVKGTLFPLASFAVVSILIWHQHRGAEVKAFLEDDTTLQSGGAGAILIVVVAFMWNAMLPVLRDALRGRYGWPGRKHAIQRLSRLRRDGRRQLDARIRDQLLIADASDEWIGELQRAYRAGVDGDVAGAYQADSSLSLDIDELAVCPEADLARRLREIIPRFAAELQKQSAERNARLDQDYEQLLSVIKDQASRRLVADAARIANWVQFYYPQGELAPTRFGNVTRSIASYAETRYGINFDFFWPRIRRNLGEDTRSALQGAQADSDLFVSLAWLASIGSAAWGALVFFESGSPWLFLAVVVAGPIAAWSFYNLAVRMQIVHADLVKGALDFERHKTFEDLGFVGPQGTQQERAMWDTLHHWLAYGEDVVLSYGAEEGE